MHAYTQCVCNLNRVVPRLNPSYSMLHTWRDRAVGSKFQVVRPSLMERLWPYNAAACSRQGVGAGGGCAPSRAKRGSFRYFHIWNSQNVLFLAAITNPVCTIHNVRTISKTCSLNIVPQALSMRSHDDLYQKITKKVEPAPTPLPFDILLHCWEDTAILLLLLWGSLFHFIFTLQMEIILISLNIVILIHIETCACNMSYFIVVFFYVRDVIDIKFLWVIALSFTQQISARELETIASSPGRRGERNDNHVGPTRSTEKEALELQGDVRSSFATGKKSSKGRWWQTVSYWNYWEWAWQSKSSLRSA